MSSSSSAKKKDLTAVVASLTERMLENNAIGETWRICYLANIFVFPIYARFEREHGMLRPEFVTLYCLGHHEPLIAQDIVNMTGLPKNNISRGVNRLLARGMIVRSHDPQDRRRAQLSLTSAGRAKLDSVMPDFLARRQALVAGLEPDELEELGRLLLKMARSAEPRPETAARVGKAEEGAESL